LGAGRAEMSFKDHFSGHAADYSTFRPSYPHSLYRWLAGACQEHDRAWDCATGNGQAARGLADFFARVDATDASPEQIGNATGDSTVRFRVAAAEESGIPGGSIDLVTVAQALHWFDLEKFYAEVYRVLKPGGMTAVWTYELSKVCPAVDEIVWRLYTDITGPYWPPERDIVDAGYKTLPFPFREIDPPEFTMTSEWTLQQYRGYLGTWSAAHRYFADTGQKPLELVDEQLEKAWGDTSMTRSISWKLNVRAGYLDTKPG